MHQLEPLKCPKSPLTEGRRSLLHWHPKIPTIDSMNQTLSAIARAVAQSIDKRQWDAHRVFNEGLVERLFFFQLLAHYPECESRLWIDYRPWPAESTESIGYWIDGDSDHASAAIEVHLDDPRDDSALESAAVWGKIIGDVLRLATAIGHCGLGKGYVLMFGELRHDAEDRRIAQFPLTTVGETRLISTDRLLSDAVMDEGFFEEIMHPLEIVPAGIELQLVAAEHGPGIGFWIWKISLPSDG